uniref:Bm7770 n=1 Tax=Brugia malayi TaxID=6279 RepID=A0A0H5SCS9_BRUMA|nr:Bm7770 [Brugia malayi]
MTEEQIMAACERSIADQLRPLQNDIGTSVRTLQENDEESDSGREKCLIRNRPATPLELSHHTKHIGTYPDGHTSVKTNVPRPQQTSYALSIKSPNDDKDSKVLVRPLPAANMDFDVKVTGNSDEESSEGNSISDDLQGINGRELKRNQLALIALSNEFENFCGEVEFETQISK